ncbi:cysteine desulfurase [Patescibacteria group bacterium AH-259-L07]|nr:cysteine desulfurase [Patescibacteria group bacterium AH-259-L07]
MDKAYISQIRNDFPIFKQRIRGKKFIYLDNAATTQKPQSVIDAVVSYYSEYNANVRRAIYALGERATKTYESTRVKVAQFINADDPHSIVFTRGTTEAINLVAYAWGRHNLGPGDEILITEMEHHSNIVPWQLAARDTGATLRYIPITRKGVLKLDKPEQYFTDQTKLVAINHQSNVFGTINPVEKIIAYAKHVGALVLVDGAQSVPHMSVDVGELNCDFLAFSGHKMLGPTGVGVLYGKRSLLESMDPFLGGGEMISSVTMEHATWNEVPYKFEAGTPNIAQVIGLGAALDYLTNIGIENIHRYEQELTRYTLNALVSIDEVMIYGHSPAHGAVISFNVADIHPHDLAQILDQVGIAIRAGHHCAQPSMRKLDVPATCRASFYLYNTPEEIDCLYKGIKKAIRFFK